MQLWDAEMEESYQLAGNAIGEAVNLRIKLFCLE